MNSDGVSIKIERFLPALIGKTNLVIFTPKMSSSWRSSPSRSTSATSIYLSTSITNSISFGSLTAKRPNKSRIFIIPTSANFKMLVSQFGRRTFQTIADSFLNYRIVGNQPMSARIKSRAHFDSPIPIAQNQHAESIYSH